MESRGEPGIGERYLADTVRAAVDGRRPQIQLTQSEAEEILAWLQERQKQLRSELPDRYLLPHPLAAATAADLEADPSRWRPYIASIVLETRELQSPDTGRRRKPSPDRPGAGSHAKAIGLQLLMTELATTRLMDGLAAAGSRGMDSALRDLLDDSRQA